MIDLNYSLAGALTGFVVGLTGVGGGALMTPILILFFGLSPALSIGTDLWFSAITKVAHAAFHLNSSLIDWTVVKRLWAGSLPTVVLMLGVMAYTGKVQETGWLTNAVGATVLVTAVGMIFAPVLKIRIENTRANMLPVLTVLAGAFIGFCVSVTSIGAGTLGSVFLLHLYSNKMTMQSLVPTDIVHAIPMAVLAGTGYLFADMVDWHLLASLLIGSIPTVLLGSSLSKKISSRNLQIILGVVLIGVGFKMIKW